MRTEQHLVRLILNVKNSATRSGALHPFGISTLGLPHALAIRVACEVNTCEELILTNHFFKHAGGNYVGVVGADIPRKDAKRHHADAAVDTNKKTSIGGNASAFSKRATRLFCQNSVNKTPNGSCMHSM
ncbi:Aste57867_17689 [Aphanomyces stellatus]|uniref:Aste57867_17689 protein n=1 Tax=Aphanomyces stellatus TaxID=120398 RepID=A0A485L8D2_9STRA|nr:hypothetical protein As57867_017628 [Aphanomyces stellatus]VFT94439.1 Aste57867_17689 [Aphanomyces stellatus]